MASTTDDLVKEIFAMLRESDVPLLMEDITKRLVADSKEIIKATQVVVNDLTTQLCNGPGGELMLALSSEAEILKQKKLKDLDVEEQLVFQKIEQAGAKGIWIRDIRLATNLQNPRLTKALKNLEGRQMIKNVKQHSHPSKKIYMLYELTPSEELTGGAWYTDGNLDEGLVDLVRKLCVGVIEANGERSLTQLVDFCRTRPGLESKMTGDHVKQILQTLIYDGLIDEQENENGESVYVNLIMQLPSTSPLSSIPCGQCPVIGECAEGNDVSPSTCQYMTEWLEF
eukprot:jgi/Ulvmu1/542/UM001_0550.1